MKISPNGSGHTGRGRRPHARIGRILALAVFCVFLCGRGIAEPAVAKSTPDLHYTAIVRWVDPRNKLLKTDGSFFSKQFELTDNCLYVLPNHQAGTIRDIRPGENVIVTYQRRGRALLANRVEQRLMRFEGKVDAMDSSNHTVTVFRHELDRTFSIARDCHFAFENGRTGGYTNLEKGMNVIVVYETPDQSPLARSIEQTGQNFLGTLKGIDPAAGTLQAKEFSRVKNFTLAPHCVIVLNGKVARIGDLTTGQKLLIRYDEENGTNLVSRIQTAHADTNANFIDEYSIDL